MSETKSGRRAAKRDREGNCRRETEIAVVFTMKIPLVSFSRALMSYDLALHTIPRTGDRVLRRRGMRGSGRSMGERTAMQPGTRTRRRRPAARTRVDEGR
jgi:hypothetical protein